MPVDISAGDLLKEALCSSLSLSGFSFSSLSKDRFMLLSYLLENNLFLHELEHNIFNSTNELNLDILKQILEYLDLEYKNSKERKDKYYVQQTR